MVAAQPSPGRGARRVLIAAALVLTCVAGFMSLLAAVDAEIALRGVPASATVVEAGEQHRSRRSWTAEVRLAVPQPDGQALVAWAERALPVSGGWSNPPRPPRPGDLVPVLVVPDTPPRIVPEDAVGNRFGWAAKLAFAWALTAGAWLALRGRRRARMA